MDKIYQFEDSEIHSLVSIVTPSYNQAQYLAETLSSVRAQDYANLEHLVLDGGSTDSTIKVLKCYEKTYNLKWVSEPDAGQSDAINKGFRRAQGEIIGWLNSDDTYLPQAVDKVVAYFQAHPDVAWVYGDGYVIDAHSRVLRTWKARQFDLKALLYRGQYICQPAAFFRRSAIQAVGLLDAELHFTMDYDFFIRLGFQCKAAYLPEILATRRLNPDAKSLAQSGEFCEDWLATLDKAFSTLDLPPDFISTKHQAYANAYYHGGIRYFEQDRFAEARKYLMRSWLLDHRLFRYRNLRILLFLLQSILQIRFLKPVSYRSDLELAEAPNSDLKSVAWPVGICEDA